MSAGSQKRPSAAARPASRTAQPGWWDSYRGMVLVSAGGAVFGIAVTTAGIALQDGGPAAPVLASADARPAPVIDDAPLPLADTPLPLAEPAPALVETPPHVAERTADIVEAPAVEPSVPPSGGGGGARPIAVAALAPVPVAVTPPVPPARSYSDIVAARDSRLQVARFAANDRVLVLDFADLAEQGRTLNRLAALVEKQGAPRDRVLDDAELDDLIRRSNSSVETFYYGHDYRAEDVARFFTLARAARIALNSDEQELQRIALQTGLMAEVDGVFHGAPGRALISASQMEVDNPATPFSEAVDEGWRAAVLRHELSHGEYFTDPAYRAHCERFWRTVLSEDQRRKFRSFLANSGYDSSNEDLMINEAQAYLMHTPDPRMFRASLVEMSDAEVAELRRRFMDGAPAAGILSDLSRPAGP